MVTKQKKSCWSSLCLTFLGVFLTHLKHVLLIVKKPLFEQYCFYPPPWRSCWEIFWYFFPISWEQVVLWDFAQVFLTMIWWLLDYKKLYVVALSDRKVFWWVSWSIFLHFLRMIQFWLLTITGMARHTHIHTHTHTHTHTPLLFLSPPPPPPRQPR